MFTKEFIKQLESKIEKILEESILVINKDESYYQNTLSAHIRLNLDKIFRSFLKSKKFIEIDKKIHRILKEKMEELFTENLMNSIIETLSVSGQDVLTYMMQNSVNNFQFYLNGHLHEFATKIILGTFDKSSKMNKLQEKLAKTIDENTVQENMEILSNKFTNDVKESVKKIKNK